MTVKCKSACNKAIIVGSGKDAMKLYAALRDKGLWKSVSMIAPVLAALKNITANESIDIIINAADDPKISRFLRSLHLEGTDILSSSCAQLLFLSEIENEVSGVTNVNSKSPENIFPGDDINPVSSLRAFTAEMIKSSREYNRTIDASFALSVLSGIRKIMHLDLPLQECLNLSMMKLVNSLQGKLCNLYWFDNNSRQFILQASSSFTINMHNSETIRLNDFFTGRALRTRNEFLFNIKIGSSKFRKWFIGHPVLQNGTLRGLLMIHLVSDRENLNKESALIGKAAHLLQESLAHTITLQTTRLQSIQYSALSEITFDLASIHNVRQLAKMIVVNACMILEAESCVLNLYNSGMGCFEIFESFSIRGTEHMMQIHNIDNRIALKSLDENNGLIINNLPESNSVSADIPIHSVITMCLNQNSNLMGALSVYNKNAFGIYEQSKFSERDREVFVKFCFQVTKALNRFFIIKSAQSL